MERLGGTVLLVGVIVLSLIIGGAVERGEITGANYASGFPIGVNWSIHITFTNSTGGSQGSNSGAGSGKSTTTTTSSGQGQSPSGSQPFGVLGSLPAPPVWAMGILVVVGLGGAFLLLLRMGVSVQEVELEATLREMERERGHLEKSWSYRLRNAALLRYYLLMRKACLKVGLRDEPAETPQEYVERVSMFFRVDGSQASQFASAVNRSSYGEELSELEAATASRFMSSFVEVIRARAIEGR